MSMLAKVNHREPYLKHRHDFLLATADVLDAKHPANRIAQHHGSGTH